MAGLGTPYASWQSIAMDFITDLPCSDGYDQLWVIVDRFTKMAHFLALPKEGKTANDLAKSSLAKSGDITGCPRISCPTGTHASLPRFGKNSFDARISALECPRPFTLRQTAKPNISTKPSKRISGPSSTASKMIGLGSYQWLSLPTTTRSLRPTGNPVPRQLRIPSDDRKDWTEEPFHNFSAGGLEKLR
jgi:hypothetical protein